MKKKLSECTEGDAVRVIKVRGSGSIRQRLLDMGFMKGALLNVIRYAPLRDPMEIVIRDCHLSLRVSEAASIDIEPATLRQACSTGTPSTITQAD
jgi:Fe2+ transport system protein FeoA